MNNTTATEIDVDSLMAAIRETASSRNLQHHFDLEEATSSRNVDHHVDLEEDTPADTVVSTVVSRPTPRLRLAPEFELRNDDHYHVNDFLKFHDRDFVRHAYRAILKREADEKGLQQHLRTLKTGAFNKIDILSSLRNSKEGVQSGVRIDGLRLPALVRSCERIPFLGYLLQLMIGLLRLPTMIGHHRQFEAYVLAQHTAIAGHVNEQQESTNDSLTQHHQDLTNHQLTLTNHQLALTNHQRDLTNHQRELTSHQRDLTSHQRELTNLPPLIDEVNNLKAQIADNSERLDSKTLLLSKRLEQVSQVLLQTRVEINAHQIALKSESEHPNQREYTFSSLPVPLSSQELLEWESLYANFESEFRGTPQEVKNRFQFYLPVVKEYPGKPYVLDLGSGRGDWLELLQQENVIARGVEANRVLAESCQKRRLDVVNEEMMGYLREVPDQSIDIVTAFHLIEHIDHISLIRLIDQINRVLKPNGIVMFETPSPENLVSAACTFYADPTHHRPIYPQTLMFILRQKGFVNLKLQFLHEVEDSPFTGDGLGFAQLHMWFFGPRDFSVIAEKSS
jgi:SAM-dependent methyltransferase